jgi:hypothetical protein
MTMTQTSRASELAARYTALKLSDEQAAIEGARQRRAIVVELLELYGTARPVADLLGITVARVGKIVGGVKES